MSLKCEFIVTTHYASFLLLFYCYVAGELVAPPGGGRGTDQVTSSLRAQLSKVTSDRDVLQKELQKVTSHNLLTTTKGDIYLTISLKLQRVTFKFSISP